MGKNLRKMRPVSQISGVADYHYFNPGSETVVPLKDSKRFLGVEGHTVTNCARDGRHNYATGEQIFLEMVRTPTGTCTTVEAWQRFMARLNETKPAERSVS